VVLAALAALLAWWLKRRREIAPNMARNTQGGWTHELSRDWGGVRIAADKRLCDVRVNGETGSYIFADLREARAEETGGAWRVALDAKDNRHGEWHLPMQDREEAHKWARILSLAVQQKL
jgi:hypothetical protein